jgi:hypothetical protein
MSKLPKMPKRRRCYFCGRNVFGKKEQERRAMRCLAGTHSTVPVWRRAGVVALRVQQVPVCTQCVDKWLREREAKHGADM